MKIIKIYISNVGSELLMYFILTEDLNQESIHLSVIKESASGFSGNQNRTISVGLGTLATGTCKLTCVGIFKQSMVARNRVGIGLHNLAELVP
jgi:hypothetical protein